MRAYVHLFFNIYRDLELHVTRMIRGFGAVDQLSNFVRTLSSHNPPVSSSISLSFIICISFNFDTSSSLSLFFSSLASVWRVLCCAVLCCAVLCCVLLYVVVCGCVCGYVCVCVVVVVSEDG